MTITPDDLVAKATKTRLGVVYRIVIDGRTALATGARCHASSDGVNFHRRTMPVGGGLWYGLIALDGVIYSAHVAITRDHGATWKQIDAYDATRHALFRDAKGTWWLGGEGDVMTSKRIDKGWKKLFKIPGDKALAFRELDGKLFVAGTGSGFWNGKAFKACKDLKGETITRIAETASGVLVCHGDGGCAYRSTDRGASWTSIKTQTKQDLEDSAWVAGALVVVGGGGVMLRSTNDGKTFQKLDSGTTRKLWTIASWGEGALFSGDDGVIRSLAARTDPYWRGAEDTFAPPPIVVEHGFQPSPARTDEEREQQFTRRHAEAVELHEARSAKLRGAAAADPDPALARAREAQRDDALQIYADWLSDRGDPRGELAQVQLRLETDPKNKDLKRAEKALFKAHGDAFLGRLANVQDVVKLEWRAGFIHKARVANVFARSKLHDGAEPAVDVDQVLAWLLDEPSARFLNELVVGVISFEDNSYAKAAQVIGKRYRPSLRSLFLGDFTSEETELNWSELGAIGSMYAALPNLRELTLRSGSVSLGSIVLPNLEKFSIITGGLDRKAAKAIASAAWPSLRSLAIQVGPTEDTSARLDDLRPILATADLPRLEELRLANLEFTDQLIEPLARCRLLPQLTTLGLEMGTLGDDGIGTMYRFQRAFAHLETIDLDDNYITKSGKALLQKAKLNFDFGTQRDDDDDNRYASGYE